MLLIEPQTGNILDANPKACSFYGFTQEEMRKKKITDFNILNSEQVFAEMALARSEQRNFFLFQHRLSDGQVRDVEVHSSPLWINGKELLYSIIIDITERKVAENKALKYSRLLKGILEGVPDIIGVHRPDHSVVFYNQAGYNFFNITEEEVEGKKCYWMLGRDKHCEPCGVVKSFNSKKLEIIERFIPEMNRFMDCRYNPILDEQGKVILVIEQLRDITEDKKAELTLKRSEESYRNLFNLSPDGMGVLRKGKIIDTNLRLVSILGEKKPENLIGKSIFDYIEKDYIPAARERLKNVMVSGGINTLKEYKFIRADGKVIDAEVVSAPLTFQGQPAIQFVLRDVTERKQQLERAALIQKQRLDSKFPLPHRANLEILYRPADIISGDLFHFVKGNDHKVVGLLGDISGKGIAAALSNSALEVLFAEVASETLDPLEILKNLNKEIPKYLGEEYVAALCFSLDFQLGEITIASGGINNFTCAINKTYFQETIKGPFLGMLEVDLFEEKKYSFKRGDKFYFYTDGLEDLLLEPDIFTKFKKSSNIKNQKHYLEDVLTRQTSLRDDTTWLAIEIT
jgi:sigma-B regulation protein RsbU (phosphoserine phosphatase)